MERYHEIAVDFGDPDFTSYLERQAFEEVLRDH